MLLQLCTSYLQFSSISGALDVSDIKLLNKYYPYPTDQNLPKI